MKFVLLILFGICILQQCNSSTEAKNILNAQWNNFKNVYKKKYASVEEEEYRKQIFKKNLEKINIHNKKYFDKEVTFKMGINEFADLKSNEFKLRLGGMFSEVDVPYFVNFNKFLRSGKVEEPNEVDWYKYGFKTEVIDQGICNSCYAQAVIGAIESRWYIKHRERIRLSAQEIVDCSLSYGNKGCNRGNLPSTFKYIIENGIGSYDKNPYLGLESECIKTEPRYNISRWFKIKSENEEDLKSAVALGPVIAVINTELPSFQYYVGGVYYDKDCKIDRKGVNHFVLILGYGTNTDGEDYWLIKNSWGPNWGVNGYIYIARNRTNQCGIATQAMYPVVI